MYIYNSGFEKKKTSLIAQGMWLYMILLHGHVKKSYLIDNDLFSLINLTRLRNNQKLAIWNLHDRSMNYQEQIPSFVKL